MCKRVFLLVLAVLLSASPSALSIPTVSKVSEYARDEGILGKGERKRKLRGNDDAIDSSQDERARLPISIRESSPELHAVIPYPWKNDYVRNEAVATAYRYGIDINKVRQSMQMLRERLGTSKINDDELILMAVGNTFYEKLARSNRRYVASRTPIGDRKFFDEWKTTHLDSSYNPDRVFEKMQVLKNNDKIKEKDRKKNLAKYAYMAMGSELLSITRELERVGKEHGVDPFKLKQWIEKLETDPTHYDKRHEELVQLATRRVMGEDLTLGRGK